MNRVAFSSALVLCCIQSVEAANVYTCKDANGQKTYQAIPCAKAEQQESHRTYRPVADTPEQTRRDRQQTAAQYRQEVAPQVTYQDAPDGMAAPQGRRASQSQIDELMRKMKSALSEKQTSTQRRATAAMYQAQLDAMQGTQSAPIQYPATPSPPLQQQTQIRHDTQGNTYTQPPGSNFVTNHRTGKQCLVVGNEVRCD